MVRDQAALLIELARELHEIESPGGTLEAVLDQVLEVVPDADAASVTIRGHGGSLSTIASTDERATTVDEYQYRLGDGPCVAATIDQEWYRSGDVAHDPRWPTWGVRAAEHGFNSLLSIPMHHDSTVAGAINLYATRVGAFDSREEIEFAMLHAAQVAMVVAATSRLAGLQVAMQTRHTIGMAQGILMAKYDLDVSQAFAVLRRYSSVTNTKLRDVAQEIVDSRILPQFPDA